MGIKVLDGGLLTTVQDAGRRGYQRYGMAVSGSVDVHSYQYANILVGNELNEAVLEASLIGPTLEFTSSAVIAVTGGDFSPKINGEPCPMYTAVKLEKGDVLSFGNLNSGCRADIAFAGGLAIDEVMQSRSTYIKAQLGGFQGRALLPGDEIEFRIEGAEPKNMAIRRMEPPIEWTGDYTVRVVMGPEDDRFTDKGIETFLNSEYHVTPVFDRMGYRLEGPEIEHTTDANVISNGIPFGAIQVPDNGQPIIMLSDRQTVGGYTKIATIINVDMPMIAQCKAGDTVRFKKISIEEAQDLFVAQKAYYKELRASFDEYREKKAAEDNAVNKAELPEKIAAGQSAQTAAADTTTAAFTVITEDLQPVGPARQMTLTIDGTAYQVTVQENQL